jgi:pantoate--beta-alanine ligase
MQMYKIDRFGSKIILYAPTVEDIYEGKPTSFDFDGCQMEGKFRPGHLTGLALL